MRPVVLVAAAFLASCAAHTQHGGHGHSRGGHGPHFGKAYVGAAATPTNPADAEIAANFERWNKSLASGDPKVVASMYAPNAVLLPTVSNEVRDTPAKIEDYFVHFLEAKPQGTINFRQIRRFGNDLAVDAGIYTFALTKHGQPVKVQARYTYVWEKLNGEWKIIYHHSSAMPERIDPSTNL